MNVPRLAPAVALAFAALAALTLAAQNTARSDAAQFAQLSHRVSLALRARAHHRRLFGISTLVIPGAGSAGSRGVHLALFDLAGQPTPSERARLHTALQAALPPPWQLLSHHTARYGEQETWVFARPNGSHATTVVCLLQPGQATLVMANASAAAILDSLQGRGIVLWSRNSVVRGLWNGFDDGSGFGPGIAFSTPVGAVNLVQLHGSAQVTTRSYFRSSLGFRFDPTGGNMQTYSLDVTGRYQVSPDEDFFGLGPNSPAQRAMYDLQTRGLRLTFAVRPARSLHFGAGEDYGVCQ